jgi:hypothetical protein
MTFIELYENKRNLVSLRNTKGIRDEINKLKKKLLKASDQKTLEILDQIKWLEDRIKEHF